MTIRELYRDDILGRLSGHSFVETPTGSVTQVDLQDGELSTVMSAIAIDVNDAYAAIRGNVVGAPNLLPRLTTAERDALTATTEGTSLFNTDAENPECFQGGSWAPTNQLISGSPTFLGSVKIGGDTTIAPNGALDISGSTAADSRIRTVRYQDTPNGAAGIQVGHARGTEGSPTALLSGDRIGQLIFVGGDGTSGHVAGPVCRGVAVENWGASARGSRLTIETVPPGATAESIALTLSEHGYPEHPTYTVATLPDVGNGGGTIFVSDETGGATMAFSDGTNWRRAQDRAIVA